MNRLDVIILVIVSLSMFFGIWKGLVRQLVTIGGVILGYALASKFYSPAAKFFPFLSQDTAKIAGFMGIFILCISVALVIGWLTGKALKVAGMGWLNRVAGGALGFLKGFLIVAVVVMLLVAFLPIESVLIKNSITVPYVVSGIRLLSSFIPGDLWEKYKKKIEAPHAGSLRNIIEKGAGKSDAPPRKRGVLGE